jgi:hypothetical protein
MKLSWVAIIVMLAVLIPLSAFAVTGIPIGGLVTAIQPCNTGILAYVLTMEGVVPVMWFWGNLPFLSHIPPHPGQYILGDGGTAVAPCVLGVIPYGGGIPILYHGSSL